MEELRQLLYYLFEKHLPQRSVVTNGHNHLMEDQTEMFSLENKQNEAILCNQLRNINGHNRRRFFKYRQLKQEEHLGLGSEDEMNIYINPRSDYDNMIHQNKGIALSLHERRSHFKTKTAVAIPQKHPNEYKKYFWQQERLELMNDDCSKSLVKTNSRHSFKNETECSLKYPWHDGQQSSKSDSSDHSYHSYSKFKGPLDDLMSKIVGERSIPYVDDKTECNDLNNTSCDNHYVNESRMHHSNCELELNGLKESLSSYSISSLKQI